MTTPATPSDAELAHAAATFATRWYPQPDDLIGGWCVMPVNQPPSCGIPEIACFTTRAVAEHVAELHNRTLDGAPGDGARPTPHFDAVKAERDKLVEAVGRMISLPPHLVAEAYGVTYTGEVQS